MKIERYQPGMRSAWDAFVGSSRNGTFLFDRGYMEYHDDRFQDNSLVATGSRGECIALLPANRSGDEVCSHAGLTYGGFVFGEKMGATTMLELFEATAAHLRADGVRRLRYKTIPYIYHAHPAEEDRYALFRNGARLYRRDVLAVAAPASRYPYQERRERRMKKARKEAVVVAESTDFAAFWSILEENLQRVHGAKPVHTVAEIERLRDRFPGSIRLHAAVREATMVAGAVIYDTGRVAHVQYIGSSEAGRESGALDLLFATLLEASYASRPYFDFGISNEDDGRVLNTGLIEQKEGFGARAVVHDFYEMTL